MRLTKQKLSKIFSKSFIVYFTLFIFVVLQIYFFIPSVRENSWTGSNPATEKIKTMTTEKKSIEQKMQGVHLLENDKNKKGWELFAEEASGSKDEQWILKKVKVRFYTDEMSSFTVTGDVGEVDGRSKDMTIRGNVITESSNGYFFETSELRYQADQKKLFSEDAVKMHGPDDKNGQGLTLTGQGLEIFVAESKIKILNQVEARKVVENKKFKLNSTSSVFSNKDREATFTGDVKLLYDSMMLKAPFAEFKYSKGKDVLEIVRVYDQVQMIDANRTGTCQELIINLLQDTMIMNGQPKVRMGADEIQGGQIVFSEKGKKIKITQMQLVRKGKK
ncbi:MAG: LPS export ABC transporter periplasmic protein LptC [Moraxellaceae bacterium]|nr:LPS export ABC transporter periplasmic protein LptC [Pseudobdellovibrionaceae bacterium]